MLIGGSVEGCPDRSPLFCDPMNIKELSYDTAFQEFNNALARAGFSQIASGLHSFRRGEATTYVNMPRGGKLIVSIMVAWRSDARKAYIFASQERLNESSRDMGRSVPLTDTGVARPYSTYLVW